MAFKLVFAYNLFYMLLNYWLIFNSCSYWHIFSQTISIGIPINEATTEIEAQSVTAKSKIS